LLFEETHTGEHFLRPRPGYVEAPIELGVFALQLQHARWRRPSNASGLVFDCTEPSLGAERALAIARQLLAQSAHEPAQLGELRILR